MSIKYPADSGSAVEILLRKRIAIESAAAVSAFGIVGIAQGTRTDRDREVRVDDDRKRKSHRRQQHERSKYHPNHKVDFHGSIDSFDVHNILCERFYFIQNFHFGKSSAKR